MRTLFMSLLVLATGCATTPKAKTASERLAELRRERQEAEARQMEAQASEQTEDDTTGAVEAQPAVEAPPTTPASPEPEPSPVTPEAPEAPAAPEAPEAPAAPEAPVAPKVPAAPSAPGAPEVAAEPAIEAGPRPGLFGIRATVLGNALSTGDLAGSGSTVGVRYFFTDWVAMNVDAGFALASADRQTVTGLVLGMGVNLYGGTQDSALRPFFAAELVLNQVGGSNNNSTRVGVGAGGGLEYWLAPQLSVGARVMLGLAAEPERSILVIGTFQPGLGVTLYTD